MATAGKSTYSILIADTGPDRPCRHGVPARSNACPDGTATRQVRGRGRIPAVPGTGRGIRTHQRAGCASPGCRGTGPPRPVRRHRRRSRCHPVRMKGGRQAPPVRQVSRSVPDASIHSRPRAGHFNPNERIGGHMTGRWGRAAGGGGGHLPALWRDGGMGGAGCAFRPPLRRWWWWRRRPCRYGHCRREFGKPARNTGSGQQAPRPPVRKIRCHDGRAPHRRRTGSRTGRHTRYAWRQGGWRRQTKVFDWSAVCDCMFGHRVNAGPFWGTARSVV